MRLPHDILSGTYTKPRFFLCEVDKQRICQLETTNTNGTLKFNAYSELSFDVGRVYNEIVTGKTKINPYYDKINSPRLIEIENVGYFELQGPELIGDGIKEQKSCQAYSLEYTLSQKYLENFYINMGTVGSVEVIYAEQHNQNIIPVRLYNPENPELSLLHLVLEKAYGWRVGHVDASLQTLSRQFEIDRESIYDFLMNEVCAKFNCYIVFDTIENTINVYAEALTSKFIADGKTNKFIITPPFAQVGTVSVDGYKTTRWAYNSLTGALILEDTPVAGAHVEVVDGALTQWETDVFVGFDNLSQEMNINYDADSIKTVLTVTYGDNNDIREANLGLPYLTDISYYYTVDWMGQELYDAYTAYLQKCNSYQQQYTENSQQILEWFDRIDFEEHRLSLTYGVVKSVSATTVGTYYVRGGTAPDYYYTEVSLPADYKADEVYYSPDVVNVTETKVANILEVFKQYYNQEPQWRENLQKLTGDFSFMAFGINSLTQGLSLATSTERADMVVNTFFAELWHQLGRTPLKLLYQEPYKKVQVTNIEAGWSNDTNDNYWYYYPTVLLLNSLETAIAQRSTVIDTYTHYYQQIQQDNAQISTDLQIDANFTPQQLIKLNAFLREDTLHLENFVETPQDSLSDSFRIKQDAMESGRIELQKLCQPQLQFSMTMANIYALSEFEPIIDQFQLGNVIRVGLRSDYIKRARLLQVNINFDDFSDFSCEFGELTNLTQSDIHADLLSQAISAGKSVAVHSGHWTKGSDQANSIDLRLQEGLLNSIEAIKAIDGTQNAYIDKWGLHLEKVTNPDTGEVDDKRIWMVNNQIVFTDDGFKTSKAVLGEFEIDNEKQYGLLAQAVVAGLVEGSVIRGGTIHIGEYYDENDEKQYRFAVDKEGNVVMNAASIEGYVTSDDMSSAFKQQEDEIWIEIGNRLQEKSYYYGTCDTAADDPYKEIACNDFVPTEGTMMVVNFAYGNTSASPVLRTYDAEDNMYEAQVHAYGKVLSADSAYNWTDGSMVTFMYSASNDPNDPDYTTGSWNMVDNNLQQVYSRISMTADGIKSEVAETLKSYSTKGELTEELNKYSSRTQTAQDIKDAVSEERKYLTGNYWTSETTESYVQQTAGEITQSVSKTYATLGQVAHYGTCGATLDVVDKYVVCEGFELYKGATISIYFMFENGVDNPTLNVNHTGSIEIIAYGEPLMSNSPYNWSAQSTITFVYDGVYWSMVDAGTLKRTQTLSTKITQTAESIKSVAEAHDDLSDRVSVVEQTAEGLTSSVTALTESRYLYGTCSTDASVQTKVVACTAFKKIEPGATIIVRFTYANTAANAKLNVNSTGARPIRVYNRQLLENDVCNWDALSCVSFVYAAGYWNIVDASTLAKMASLSTQITQTAEQVGVMAEASDALGERVSTLEVTAGTISTTVTNLQNVTNALKKPNYYGKCNTVSTIATKLVVCDTFELYDGATIAVKFLYENKADRPQLNVNSTGAKDIMAYDNTLSADSAYGWYAGSTVSFVYDGDYEAWRLIDAGALAKAEALSTSITQTAEQIELVAESNGALGTRIGALEVSSEAIKSTVNSMSSRGGRYVVCDTAADVRDKIIEDSDDLIGFDLYNGATISVKFTYGNTHKRSGVRLKVGNFVPHNIVAYGQNVKANNYPWDDGAILTFVYDDANEVWNIVDSGALSRINQTADKIALLVTENGDGTSFEVNSDAVRIAWNNSNNYIQFDNGAMNIYTNTTHNDNNLLMKHTSTGAWYYNSGTTIGRIGTNQFDGDSNYRGLVFDLENDASYMCWAARDSASDTSYEVKLIYHHKSTKEKKGLHFSCNTYADNYLYLNDTVRLYSFSNGSAGLTATSTSNASGSGHGAYVQAARNDGYVTRFSCYSDMFELSNTTSSIVKCINNIDMCGYSVLNQSDARLKANIKNTDIDAIGFLNQIEMKQFDWIENGEHEDIGIIAQQLQALAPALVWEDPSSGKLSIKTDKLVPYLVKAIQELTEYITGGMSTFSLRNQWSDPYTDEEKDAFVAKTVPSLPVHEDIKHEPILIPINGTVSDNE